MAAEHPLLGHVDAAWRIAYSTWVSSYRLFLAYIQDLDSEPQFSDRDLVVDGSGSLDAVRNEALWDVIFTRVAGVQEYGFHAGLDDLMWATDCLGEGLAEGNWPMLKEELGEKREEWTERIISHAKQEGVFFAQDERAPAPTDI